MNTEKTPSSGTPEPLAAIAHEIRTRAFQMFNEISVVVKIDTLKDWADRIAAAAERERIQRDKVSFHCGDCALFGSDCDAGDVDGNEDCIACEKFRRRAASGNAAAMRAALAAFVGYLTQKRIDEVWAKTTLPEPSLDRLIEQARAALSAPARNCDRFAVAEEAVVAFADHLRAWENAHGIHSEYPDHPVQVPAGAFAWLFAPTKGGAK